MKSGKSAKNVINMEGKRLESNCCQDKNLKKSPENKKSFNFDKIVNLMIVEIL